MALSDLAVYSEYAYETMTETVAQNVLLFNEASNGAMLLRSAAHVGDYSDMIMWAKVNGTVRRRNAYGTASITTKHLTNLIDTMVKVAAGTYTLEMNPSQFTWIQQNPKIAGVIYGRQLAGDVLQDMVNTAIGALTGALVNFGTGVYDTSTATDNADTRYPVNTAMISPIALTAGAQLFGDRAAAIACWIMHSKPAGDLYNNALLNHERLFSYSTVNVNQDPFGRRYIVSDIPALVITGTPNKYYTLGLTPAAVMVDQNDDYYANEDARNGNENITITFQAEWTYNLGIKGFTWNKGSGGHSPNDAALFLGTNWTETATSLKDTAGIVVKSK